jgi:hypothetical protein
MASLSRRIYKTHDVNIKDLECLKRIYLVKMDKQEALSKMNEDQKALIAKLGVQMEVG